MSENSPEIEDDTGHYESGLPGFLGTIDVWISKIEALMLAAGVILMAVNTCANVIARFVFSEGLFFSGEINRILIILITFAGIGYAARHGRHIRMSAIYDELPDKLRKAMMVVIALITGAIMFLLAWYSLEYVYSVYGTGRIAPVTQIPIYLTLIWLPLGFVITGIQYVLTALVNLTRPDVYLSVTVVDSYEDTETQL